jgi:hypothetical protein
MGGSELLLLIVWVGFLLGALGLLIWTFMDLIEAIDRDNEARIDID